MPPTLYLIDGHALAYRTYFALSRVGGDRFQTRSGEPTAGIYGFMNVLFRLLEKEKPEYLAVAFDTGKTFRDEMYPEYKATREKMPADLRPQIERIRQIIDAFQFPRLEAEGFEADDVLGTIANRAVEQGFGVKIITGDRDLLQLVNERIIVNLPGKKSAETIDYTPEKVVEYMGVTPGQVVDYKALVGDSSDNIPGVPGVGNKTALTLLSEHKTLDDVYANLETLPTRVQARLEAGRQSAYLSYDLATIRTDVEIIVDLEEARTNHIDYAAVGEIFKELEFKTFFNRMRDLSAALESSTPAQLSLFGDPTTASTTPIERIGSLRQNKINVEIIDSIEGLDNLVSKISSAPGFSFDTETTGTDPLQSDLVGISIAFEEGAGCYIPIGHTTGKNQLPLSKVIEVLGPIFEDENLEKYGHNLKYDCLVLAQNGMHVKPLSFDTMIAGWLVAPDSRHLGLKDMADDYLGIEMTRIETLIGKGKNQISMAEVPVDQVAPYAAADAEIPLQLMKLLAHEMEERNAAHLFKDLEMPLIPVLMIMEQNGIGLNAEFFDKMALELDARTAAIQDQIHAMIGQSINLNSTQQLSKALFDTLALKPPRGTRRTASGQYSTSADVLEGLRGEHAVIDLLLEYRELTKLKSTYVNALPLQINPNTSRVHTSLNQIGSVTGRLASSNPNLQNIPTRTDLGRKVREGFIPSPRMVLLSVDYSQIELRIVAHMSGDVAMLAAFRGSEDIHAATASAIYGIPLNSVSKDQRRHAKAINFGLIYGMSAFGLTRTTGLTLAEAETFSKAYFQQYPEVKKYLDGLRQQAAAQGYVETLLGRRRYFPHLSGQTNSNLRARSEREAINAPIQGTAADIMKIAMIRLPDVLKASLPEARLLLQVHDELLLECPHDLVHETAKVVQKVMEDAFKLSIPLNTEARSGINWGKMTRLMPDKLD
jgi:DNA polymerase I